MSQIIALTLPPSPPAEEPNCYPPPPPPTTRSIWLKSTSPFVSGQEKSIPLKVVYDSVPSGGSDIPVSQCSFVVAIGSTNPNTEKDGDGYGFTAITAVGKLFAAETLKWHEDTGAPYLWAGFGASIVQGDAYTISLVGSSEVACSLIAGDYVFLNINFGKVEIPKELIAETPTKETLVSYITRVSPRLGGSSHSSSQSSGLGPGKDDIKGTANKNDVRREVKIGYRPIMGAAGNFFSGITPMWMQHWGVIVGEYFHELNANDDLVNVYENGKLEGQTFKHIVDTGFTTFNDRAIADAAHIALAKMPPKYELKYNNCQKFTIGLLDEICQVGRKKWETSYSPSAVEPGPEFKWDPELKELVEVPRPVRPAPVEEPVAPKESVQLYYESSLGAGTEITEELVTLSTEQRAEVLQRAKNIMEGAINSFGSD